MICFESLNPIEKGSVYDDEEKKGSKDTDSTPKTALKCSQIFDIIQHFAQPDPTALLPTTPVICKPSEHAIQLALKKANINPKRTVRKSTTILLTFTTITALMFISHISHFDFIISFRKKKNSCPYLYNVKSKHILYYHSFFYIIMLNNKIDFIMTLLICRKVNFF